MRIDRNTTVMVGIGLSLLAACQPATQSPPPRQSPSAVTQPTTAGTQAELQDLHQRIAALDSRMAGLRSARESLARDYGTDDLSGEADQARDKVAHCRKLIDDQQQSLANAQDAHADPSVIDSIREKIKALQQLAIVNGRQLQTLRDESQRLDQLQQQVQATEKRRGELMVMIDRLR